MIRTVEHARGCTRRPVRCGESNDAQDQSRDGLGATDIISKCRRWGEKEMLPGALANQIRCVRSRTPCPLLPRQREGSQNAANSQSCRQCDVLVGVLRIRTAENGIDLLDLCVCRRHAREERICVFVCVCVCVIAHPLRVDTRRLCVCACAKIQSTLDPPPPALQSQLSLLWTGHPMYFLRKFNQNWRRDYSELVGKLSSPEGHRISTLLIPESLRRPLAGEITFPARRDNQFKFNVTMAAQVIRNHTHTNRAHCRTCTKRKLI
jgi:hypothetical protein